MDDRLRGFFDTELERKLVDLVEAKFEALRTQPLAVCDDLPIIGPVMGCPFNPKLPNVRHRELVDLVVRALLAREWFRREEAPPWCPPLPLHENEIIPLMNCYDPDRRFSVLGSYAWHLRGYHWHVERATPFHIFCAERLKGSSCSWRRRKPSSGPFPPHPFVVVDQK